MKRLRLLRLPAALAMALTLMACAASGSRTEPSIFDMIARAGAMQQQKPAGCDARYEVKSCQSTTGIRDDGACTCIPRETLRDLRPF